ncbi:carboxypeptidase regulatory-like domain-containing protein [Streptomyces sp. NPDC059651]|uniref:MFS transporter n=1 Tax=Streptomyces sp. NPDC059651 TaxID=3346897 RepID=UPI00368BBCC3
MSPPSSMMPSVPPLARWFAIAVAALAQLLAMLNVAVATTAPSARAAAQVFDADTRRMTVLCACAVACVLVTCAALRRSPDPRPAVLIGLLGSATCAAVAVAAPNSGVLAAACVLEAVSASFAQFGALCLLFAACSRAAAPLARTSAGRGPLRALALFGVIAAFGAALSRSAGELLTKQLGWRWVMCGISVLTLITLVLGVVLFLGRPALVDPLLQADNRSWPLPTVQALAAAASALGPCLALLYGWQHAPVALDLAPVWTLTAAVALATRAIWEGRHTPGNSRAPIPAPARTRVLGSVRSDDGKPLARAALTLLTPEGDDVARTRTGADGRFSLDASGTGGFVLVAGAGTYHPAVTELTLPAEQPAPRHRLTLVADPVRVGTHVVTGRVWDASDGIPVPRTRVVLMSPDGALATVPTDTGGHFTLDGLARETYTLVLLHEDYRPSAMVLQITSNGPSPLDVVLTPRSEFGRLEGVILSERGVPAPGVLLTLTDESGLGLTTTTEPDGRYRFADVPVGDYILAAGAPPAVAAVRIVEAPIEKNLSLRTPHQET